MTDINNTYPRQSDQITWPDGTQMWWREGKLHREDGPALTWLDGTQEWYRDGKRIRRYQ